MRIVLFFLPCFLLYIADIVFCFCFLSLLFFAFFVRMMTVSILLLSTRMPAIGGLRKRKVHRILVLRSSIMYGCSLH